MKTINKTLENDTLSGTWLDEIIGSACGSSSLDGGTGRDFFSGGEWADFFSSWAWDSPHSGGTGSVSLIDGPGADTVAGSGEPDSFVFGPVNEEGLERFIDFTQGILNDLFDLIGLQITAEADRLSFTFDGVTVDIGAGVDNSLRISGLEGLNTETGVMGDYGI